VIKQKSIPAIQNNEFSAPFPLLLLFHPGEEGEGGVLDLIPLVLVKACGGRWAVRHEVGGNRCWLVKAVAGAEGVAQGEQSV